MSFKDNVFATQDPGSGLILVADGEGVVKPVGDVGAPLSLSETNKKLILHT